MLYAEHEIKELWKLSCLFLFEIGVCKRNGMNTTNKLISFASDSDICS